MLDGDAKVAGEPQLQRLVKVTIVALITLTILVLSTGFAASQTPSVVLLEVFLAGLGASIPLLIYVIGRKFRAHDFQENLVGSAAIALIAAAVLPWVPMEVWSRVVLVSFGSLVLAGIMIARRL